MNCAAHRPFRLRADEHLVTGPGRGPAPAGVEVEVEAVAGGQRDDGGERGVFEPRAIDAVAARPFSAMPSPVEAGRRLSFGTMPTTSSSAAGTCPIIEAGSQILLAKAPSSSIGHRFGRAADRGIGLPHAVTIAGAVSFEVAIAGGLDLGIVDEVRAAGGYRRYRREKHRRQRQPGQPTTRLAGGSPSYPLTTFISRLSTGASTPASSCPRLSIWPCSP
jgi:hypothetical protein